MNLFLILAGKLFSFFITRLSLGSGATWPGHIALKVNSKFIKEVLKSSNTKLILIAGTNGKTTTSKLLQHILEIKGTTMHNSSGANLLNGIASTLIINSNLMGKIKKSFSILEVDENTLPLALKELTPDTLILLNLFRDQLDRYGEVNSIAKKWKEEIDGLPGKTTLILNSNDPVIAHLGDNRKNAFYFGLEEKSNIKSVQDWADSVFCPRCEHRLNFSKVYFSHIGEWTCPNCHLKTPSKNITKTFYPLKGTYNKLNALAAALAAEKAGLTQEAINRALKNFNPAFGRQEIINYNGKKIHIFLSKNPTGFNESLNTLKNARSVLFALNDRIPDGRDVSWIWDVDFESYADKFRLVVLTGDRTYDLALRLKYASFKNFVVEPDLKKAIKKSINETKDNLYILPTYSAMLEIRKVLTGRKIL